MSVKDTRPKYGKPLWEFIAIAERQTKGVFTAPQLPSAVQMLLTSWLWEKATATKGPPWALIKAMEN